MPHTLAVLAFLTLSSIPLPRALEAQEANAPSSDDDARGFFLKTRAESPNGIPGGGGSGAKPAESSASFKPGTSHKPQGGKKVSGPVAKPASAKPRPAEPDADAIGLGYTLFKFVSGGNPVEVSAADSFREGDRVRFVFESTVDGYLYVFYAENGANPEMIYPTASLAGGDNRVRAHVGYEVPSSRAQAPAPQWFEFTERPAIERLYFVVSREPLPGVPTEKALVTFCGAQTVPCTWRPEKAAWASLVAHLDAPVRVSEKSTPGRALTKEEDEAIGRSFGLAKQAPEPAVIKVAAAPGELFVTSVDLVHK